jgi:hypothetical protein
LELQTYDNNIPIQAVVNGAVDDAKLVNLTLLTRGCEDCRRFFLPISSFLGDTKCAAVSLLSVSARALLGGSFFFFVFCFASKYTVIPIEA